MSVLAVHRPTLARAALGMSSLTGRSRAMAMTMAAGAAEEAATEAALGAALGAKGMPNQHLHALWIHMS